MGLCLFNKDFGCSLPEESEYSDLAENSSQISNECFKMIADPKRKVCKLLTYAFTLRIKSKNIYRVWYGKVNGIEFYWCLCINCSEFAVHTYFPQLPFIKTAVKRDTCRKIIKIRQMARGIIEKGSPLTDQFVKAFDNVEDIIDDINSILFAGTLRLQEQFNVTQRTTLSFRKILIWIRLHYVLCTSDLYL